MINVLSMLFSVVIRKYVQKLIQKTFVTYKHIEHDLHFDGIKFQTIIMILINLKNSIRMFQ